MYSAFKLDYPIQTYFIHSGNFHLSLALKEEDMKTGKKGCCVKMLNMKVMTFISLLNSP